MGDRMDMDQLRQEQLVKRTRLLVWAESLVILGLLIWVSLEYENNLFLQSWAKSNVGPLGLLLNGTLAGLYAGALLGYSVAKYAGRRCPGALRKFVFRFQNRFQEPVQKLVFRVWLRKPVQNVIFECSSRGIVCFPEILARDQVRPVLVLLLSFSVFFGTGYATCHSPVSETWFRWL